MTMHRVPRTELEVTLVALVRSGQHIDNLTLDGDEWIIHTEDRIEIRVVPHAARLGVRS